MISIKTYINNEEVQPAPSVREVGLEAIRNPFQEHLNDKNVGEDLISIFENDFNHSSLLNVNILKRLIREEKNMSSELKAVPPLKKNKQQQCFSVSTRSPSAHQGTAAEENHEDDEGLKVVVLHNGETGLTEVPPCLSSALGDVHIQAWAASNAFFNAGGRR